MKQFKEKYAIAKGKLAWIDSIINKASAKQTGFEVSILASKLFEYRRDCLILMSRVKRLAAKQDKGSREIQELENTATLLEIDKTIQIKEYIKKNLSHLSI